MTVGFSKRQHRRTSALLHTHHPRCSPWYPLASQENVTLLESHVLNLGMTSIARSEIWTAAVLLTICACACERKGQVALPIDKRPQRPLMKPRYAPRRTDWSCLRRGRCSRSETRALARQARRQRRRSPSERDRMKCVEIVDKNIAFRHSPFPMPRTLLSIHPVSSPRSSSHTVPFATVQLPPQ